MKKWLVAGLLIGMLGCNREPTPRYVPERIKKLFLFAPGSWWVYRDSIKHVTDSYVVVGIESEMRYNQADNEKLEYVHMKYDKYRLDGESSRNILHPVISYLNYEGGINDTYYPFTGRTGRVVDTTLMLFGNTYTNATKVESSRTRPIGEWVVQEKLGVIRLFHPADGPNNPQAEDFLLVKSSVQMQP